MKKILVLLAVGLMILGCGKKTPAVSSIEEEKLTGIPGLVGKNLEDQQTALVELGLGIDLVYVVDTNHKNGEIMAQDPAAGQKVKSDSVLSLTVNKTDTVKKTTFTADFKALVQQNKAEDDVKSLVDKIFEAKGTAAVANDALASVTLLYWKDISGYLIDDDNDSNHMDLLRFNTRLYDDISDFSLMSKEEEERYTQAYLDYLKEDADEDDDTEDIEIDYDDFVVFKSSDLQNYFDGIWGENRIDVSKTKTTDNFGYIVSENGYIYVTVGPNFAGTATIYHLVDIQRTVGDNFIVSLNVIDISRLSKGRYEVFDFGSSKITSLKNKPDLSHKQIKGMNYADVVAKIGYTKSTKIEVEVYRTKGGLFFWGVID